MRRHRKVLLLLAGVALLAAGGCGSDDGSSGDNGSNGVESKSPEQVLTESAAALRKVKSFHAEAKEAGGKRRRMKVDVAGPGKLRIELRQGSATASMIVIDGSNYINANAAFWRQEADAGAQGAQLAGRWFKAPSSVGGDLEKEFDPAHLSRCLVRGHGTLVRGGTATVAGRPAAVIVDEGDRPGANPGKLFVATTGEPLPLRMLATGQERPGGRKDPECDSDDSPTTPGDEVVLSRYDEPVDIEEPPAAVDLGGGTSS